MAYIGFEVAPHVSDTWSAFPGALLHITLAHFEKPTWLQTRTLAHRLLDVTRGCRPPVLVPDRVAIWQDVGPVLLLQFNDDVQKWRRTVLDQLVKLNITPSRTYDYTPHMTLGDVRVEEPQVKRIKPIGLELCGCTTITRAAFPFLV